MSLRNDDRDLEGEPVSEARQDLIPNPFACRCSNVESKQYTSGNGYDHRASCQIRSCNARLRDDSACDKGGNAKHDNERNVAHTRANRTAVVDALEIDGQIIERDEIRASEEKAPYAVDPDGPLAHNSWCQHGAFALPYFYHHECKSHDNEADE